VGAHIYLVQPGTAGYGSVVKGLLTASSANAGYPTTQNGSWTNSGYASDQFVPAADAAGNPFHGVTSDSTGSYMLSGDYTCTVGQPVIAIGYGGSPSYPSGSNTFQISQVEITNYTGSGATSTATYTFTTTTTELFYVGEAVEITAFSGAAPGTLPYTNTVLATNLTTNTFSFTVTGQDYGNGTYPATGTAVASPTFNPAAVNLAVLGNCPSSGNFSTPGNGAISFIYMNEISTAAAAYAFAGFTNTAATDQTGNDEFHIGSTGTTQGLQGIANAAITAGLLYDITGSNLSTTYAGEGHIARSVTPNGGYGTVPQATLDTIGNILAACVDSNNTYRSGSGTISAQCQTLDQYAQDNGVYDTSATTHYAFNIAQAALNLARFPQGAGTGTTSGGVQTVTHGTATSAANFVSNLYSIPTGNVPFAPNLVSTGAGKPNDFAVPILWNVGAASSDTEIDAGGNAFVAAGTSGLYQITPSGVVSVIGGSPTYLSSALSAGLAIDLLGSVWASGTTGVFAYNAGGGVHSIDGGNSGQGAGVAVDNLPFANNGPDVYVASGSDGTSATYPSELSKQFAVGGGAAGGNFPIVGNAAAAANTAGICEAYLGFVTLDSSNNVWTASSENAQSFQQPYVCRFSNAGALQYSYQVPSSELDGGTPANEAGGFSFPRGLATDNGDNLFFTDKNSDGLYKIAKGTTTNNTGATYLQAHTQLQAPSWIAVDGANTIWVSSTGDAGATTGGKSGTGLVQFSDAMAVTTAAYITGAPLSASPTTCLNSVAIDPSGNVWASQGLGQGTCTTANQVEEFVGLATPTRTPLSVAKGATAAGTKP
jgi:hypothetical protein